MRERLQLDGKVVLMICPVDEASSSPIGLATPGPRGGGTPLAEVLSAASLIAGSAAPSNGKEDR